MIDYRAIPDVAAWISQTHQLLEDDDERKQQIGMYHRFNEGRKLILEIEVTDTDLFQIVVSSMWGDAPLSIPGARLQILHLDDAGKQYIVGWLEKQLGELRNG
jgi:hypothetical protein